MLARLGRLAPHARHRRPVVGRRWDGREEVVWLLLVLVSFPAIDLDDARRVGELVLHADGATRCVARHSCDQIAPNAPGSAQVERQEPAQNLTASRFGARHAATIARALTAPQ
jgi:hypothetical protein